MQTALMIPVALLGTLALLLVAGVVFQITGTWRDRRRFPPPGRLVRFNKRRMHIHVTGEGAPTVVFESGMGASCLSWTLVQPQVAQFTRAVSYDRAGHGWSDPAGEPRTAQQIAQELHALLEAAGVPGPYVLVGHSFGGYVNRAFAHLYRDKVVGMVLVDSLYPADWENPTTEQLRMIEVGLRYAWIAAWLARLGFVRFCLARLARGSPKLGWAAASAFGADTAAAVQRIAGEIRKLPAPILPIVRGLWSQPKNFLSLGQYVAALPVSAAQAAAVNSLGDLPLVVISGDHHAAPYADWQCDLAQLSSRGRQLVASDSGHWIHLDHPELVSSAVHEVVIAARHAAQVEGSAQTLQQQIGKPSAEFLDRWLSALTVVTSSEEETSERLTSLLVRYCLFLGCSTSDQSVDLKRARSIEERPKHVLAIAKKILRAAANDYTGWHAELLLSSGGLIEQGAISRTFNPTIPRPPSMSGSQG